MQTWQTTLFLLRALCSRQQCRTLLKALPKNLTCKTWPRWPIVPLCRVHTSSRQFCCKWCCTMLLLKPDGHLQESSLQMASCCEKRSRMGPKTCHLPTTMRCSQMHKGMQLIECRTILCWNLFHIPHCLWARAMGKEEELEEKDEMRKISWMFSRVGACSCGRMVSAVRFVVWTFSSPFLFAAFKSCRSLALLFRCITGYKQPPPSLHRRHYCVVWYWIQFQYNMYVYIPLISMASQTSNCGQQRRTRLLGMQTWFKRCATLI